jgi:glutamate synthase (NADPH/NADH) large chain
MTGSTVAGALLRDWRGAVERFSALVPRDFRRVREATRLAQEAGADVDAAVMAAART